MNWFKKSLTVLLATITLFGTGISTPIVAEDGDTKGETAQVTETTPTPAATSTTVTTAEPTAAPTATVEPTATPTATPEATVAPTATSAPTAEASAAPVATQEAVAFNGETTTDHYTVTVSADAGTLPAGVTLVASELNDQTAEYKTAKEAVEASKGTDEATFDNSYKMAALDIHFDDANGNEVEPDTTNNKKVNVSITIKQVSEVLGFGADAKTLEIHHIDDESNNAEVVADSSKVLVDESTDTVETSFETNSFSIFTVTTAVQAPTALAAATNADSSDITLAHTKTISAGENGTYDLTLDITGAAGTKTNPAKVDVVFIVDASGSMILTMNGKNYGSAEAGTRRIDKLAYAEALLTKAIDANKSISARYSAVSFSGHVDHWYSDTQYDDANVVCDWTTSKTTVDTAISNIDPNGGTNYQAGFYTAKNYVLNNVRSGAQTVVVFLTDGQPNIRYDSNGYSYEDDYNANDGAVAEVQNGGLSVTRFYAIGIASNASDYTTNLGNIKNAVTAKDSSVKSATSASDLNTVFSGIAADVSTMVVSNVSVYDELSQYVEFPSTGSNFTIKEKDNSGNVVATGTITNAKQGDNSVKLSDGKTYTLKLDGTKFTLVFPTGDITQNHTYSITTTIQASDAAKQYYKQNGTYPDGNTGFYSNADGAKVHYTYDGTERDAAYSKPVITVPDVYPVSYTWTDQPSTGVTLPSTTEKYFAGEEYTVDSAYGDNTTTVGDGNYTYTFHGWYMDAAHTQKAAATVEISGALTLYGYWTKIYSGEITVTTTGGTFTYDGQAHGATVAVTGLPKGYTLKTATSDATATDVTATAVAATADHLEIDNAEGEDVTSKLNIKKVDGSIVINPATLTVKTPNATKVYDGTALTAAGTISGFVNGETATFETTGSQTIVGGTTGNNTYSLTWDGTATESNYIIAETVGTLIVTRSNENAILANNYTGTYDAKAHTISANAVRSGSTLYYSEDNKTWSETLPEYTNAASLRTVYIKATNPNYKDAFGTATVTINKRNVTLTSGTSSKVYDGTALTNNNVTLSDQGFVAGEGATYAVTGTQTEVGNSDNTFTYTLNAGTIADNYDIATVTGTLTITARPVTPVTPDDGGRNARPSTPNTGDQTNAPMAAGALAFSMLLAGLAFFFRRKYSD